MMRKVLFWCTILIVLTGFAYLVFTPRSFRPVGVEPADLGSINIILVGDLMFDRGVAYMIDKKGNGDFTFPFLNIADELNKADLVFGNLEGPISDKGTKVGSIYSFRNDPRAIDGLTFAGFNIISLANNHAFDYSREALEDCLTRLSAAGISYIGAGFNEKETFSPIIKEVAGTKIGFLAYTNLGPKTWRASGENSGIAWTDNELFDLTEQQIRQAKQDSDILIVSLHAGEEYQETPTQFQIDFNEMAGRAGADVVVNHHPHVIQQNFYSLGNFIFDQGFSEETMESEIIEIKVRDKKIEDIVRKNIKINNFFQPELE